MSVNKIEIQDENANIYYPHTDASVVKYGVTDVGSALTEVETKLADSLYQTADYASYASTKDGDIYTVVDFKRNDGTLYLNSTLSNPDANGYYQTCTLKYYDLLGTTVIKTVVWTLTYDANGTIITKVVA